MTWLKPPSLKEKPMGLRFVFPPEVKKSRVLAILALCAFGTGVFACVTGVLLLSLAARFMPSVAAWKWTGVAVLTLIGVLQGFETGKRMIVEATIVGMAEDKKNDV